MIGHELTNLFGIDHGKTLAILQPAIWSVMHEQKHAKLLQYAQRVWNINEGSEESRVEHAINKTREFFNSLGIKTKLSDYGVSAQQLPLVVEALEEHKFTALSETGKITPEKVLEILKLAL
ncbi:MAG: NADH-dependent alcohol dehydrogenase, partial [Lentisphaeria bacterium]